MGVSETIMHSYIKIIFALLAAISVLAPPSLGAALVYTSSQSADFGSKVALEDKDLSRLLYNFSPPPYNSTQAFMYSSQTAPGYVAGDPVYLHRNLSNNVVEIDDIRLTSFSSGIGSYQPGSKVKRGDADLGRLLTGFGPNSYIGFIERGTPGYGWENLVYFHASGTIIPGSSTGGISRGDIRLTAFGGIPAGTAVYENDPDFGYLLTPLTQFAIRFFNANGDQTIDGLPVYDQPDAVYLDISNLKGTDNVTPLSFGFVVVNDIRLSK